MSLVADYSDSSAEEDEEENNAAVLVNPSSNSTETPSTASKPFFESRELSSDDDANSSEDEEECDKSAKNKGSSSKGEGGAILANPFRYFGSGSVAAEDSVLRVEFREQAAQKTALMERHVKMSETDGAAEKINGKTVCWQNRKGKCRFGHNCKFAHDSDIVNPFAEDVPKKTFQTTEKLPPESVIGGEQSTAVVTIASGAHLSGDNLKKRKPSVGMISDDEDESGDKNSGKKKRPGLSATLVPGKKVMGMYYKSKNNP